MKKVLKRILFISLIAVLLVVNYAPTEDIVEAKTLRTLKQELEAKRKEYEENQNKQQATQAQIDDAKAKAIAISKEIEDIQKEMVALTEEIEVLNGNIEEKSKEIKNIINYYQLASGENAYLEYVFNAADFTDFIYRSAVSEQLTSYNDKLIDEYSKMIIENENKKVDLAAKTVALNEKQKELEKQISVYETELQGVVEGAIGIKEELEMLEEFVRVYEKAGCKLDEDITSCGSNKLPPGTAFFRPIVSGSVSSNYGYRTYYINGKQKSEFHYGMDFSVPHGTPVYSSANGQVVAIWEKYRCGGNMVWIAHNINGTKYTTAYYHLSSINVSVGQAVTYNTVIGYSGGNPRIETWDKCTTGAHLHFQLATGAYMIDYKTYSAFQARSINPRNVVNIPDYRVYFSSRDRKY